MAFAVPQWFLRDWDRWSIGAAECAVPGGGPSQSSGSPDPSLYKTQGDELDEIRLGH